MSNGGEPVRRPTRTSNKQASANTAPDPFYGHEETARICGRFISDLFSCPDYPVQAPTASAQPPTPAPPLANFIAYALHRTRLHSCVTFTALFLLQRLKTRFPAARGSSGYRLFISAFMIASKVVCDDTYSNKSWCVVGQGMFTLKEINQMEREMCSYLEWKLNFSPAELADFEARVRRDFLRNRPAVAPAPAMQQQVQQPHHHAQALHHAHHPPAPPKPSYPSPPASPATPASAASSGIVSPPAPDDSSSVSSSRASSMFSHQSSSTLATSMASSSQSSSQSQAQQSSQSKSGEPGFAFASRSVW